LNDFKEEDAIDFNKLEEIDKWILIKFSKVKSQFLDLSKEYSFHQALNALLFFSSKELSSIYLDSQKDVLYTFSKNSIERLSTQSSISIIFRELSLLLSPIISFTAEEAWSERYSEETVFNSKLSSELYSDRKLEEKWDRVLSIREPILKEIELMRTNKILGSSLEAKIILGFDSDNFDFYLENTALLKKTLIVSEIEIYKSDKFELDIKVEKTLFKKCERCWMHFDEQDFDSKDSDLCSKCSSQMKKNI